MSKQLLCDAIFPGCPGEVKAENEDEVFRIAVDHAKQVHGVTVVDDATAAKIKAAIRDA
jgi:predicted small metal-binding protein